MSKRHDCRQRASDNNCNPRQHNPDCGKPPTGKGRPRSTGKQKPTGHSADGSSPKPLGPPVDPWSDPWDNGPLAAASKNVWDAFVGDEDEEDGGMLPGSGDLDGRSA